MNKWLVPLVILLALTLILAGCGKSSSTTAPATTTPGSTTAISTSTQPNVTTPASEPTSAAGPRYGGTLRYVSGYSPSMNCGWPLDNDWSGIWLINFIYAEPLIFYRIDGTVEPMLAESWELGPDDKSITFNLRKGVKFHDGTEFNADAVKFMLDSNIEAKTAGAANWTSVEIVNDYAVRINFVEFSNALWSTLASKNCQIVSPKGVRENGTEWAREHPVGTGPFKFVSFERDKQAVFENNPDYWQEGKPYIDRLEFIFVKEEMTQQSYMLSGEGHILTNAAGRTLADMGAKGFQTFAYAAGTDFLTPDSAKDNSYFKDKRVREALEYSIDKAAICQALGYGYMTPNNQLTPPKHPYFTPGLPDRAYDPDKARTLLAEAGYPNGFTTKISTQILWKDEALAVQQYLKKVGIESEVEVLDGAKWWDLCRNGWEGLLFAGFSFGPNFADSFKTQFPPYADNNVDLKMPDGVKELIDAALLATDPEEQAKYNRQLVKLIVDDVTVIGILSNAIGYVVADNVRDGHFLEGDAWQYWNPATIWLDE